MKPPLFEIVFSALIFPHSICESFADLGVYCFLAFQFIPLRNLEAYWPTLVSLSCLVTTSWVPFTFFVFSVSASSFFECKEVKDCCCCGCCCCSHTICSDHGSPSFISSKSTPSLYLHVFFLSLLRKELGQNVHWELTVCHLSLFQTGSSRSITNKVKSSHFDCQTSRMTAVITWLLLFYFSHHVLLLFPLLI